MLSFETVPLERAGEGDEGGAPVLGRGREAGVVLWQEDLSSWGRRFCKVPNMRSERPLASGA